MPVYNGQRYLREAIDSLLAQTFTDFELIISDNASTDDTETICREYAERDPRICFVRQRENRGAMANFLFVLTKGVGKYFMWAAADDRWDAGWLATTVRLLDPDVCVAFGSVVNFQDDNPEGVRSTLKSIRGPRTLRMVRYYLWNNATYQKANVIYGLYRTAELRKVASEVLGPADNRWGFDNILVFAMLQYGGLRVEPNVALYKRTRPVTGNQTTGRAMSTKLRRLGPYLFEHIRRSPPGLTQCAVLAATPIKYGWQLYRGLRRTAILLSRRTLTHRRA